MTAMTNLANTMQAGAAATTQAMERIGRPAENGIGDDEGNGNNLGGVPMTLAVFLKSNLSLKQGFMYLAEYTKRFEELYRFSKVCLSVLESYEGWKCIKYQRGLEENIMSVVAPFEIRRFSELVNKARVVEECAKKLTLARDTCGGTNNRGLGKYLPLRTQNCKRGGHAP
ncbi:hypothetical protein AHAS_Ahas15G0239800 [Arachis hypogaea]